MSSGKIIYNDSVTVDTLRMGVAVDESFTAKPGQFIMVRCSGGMELLLRRPFSILSVRDYNNLKGYEILYKIVGTGTQRLADLKEGDRADFLGPFGHGFHIHREKELWLVAGGIGVPPILFLAEEIHRSGIPAEQVQIFFGSRTLDELYCLKDLEKLGYPIQVTTDDGSYGESGFISNPLIRMLEVRKRSKQSMPVLYACGPEGLLRVLTRSAELYGIEVQISMEMRMGCGLGICQGCVVKTRRNKEDFDYVRACVDGPVFNASDIIWL